MRRKKKKRVILNERDRELFNYLYEVKIANARQLKRDIFKEVSLTVMYRRMKALSDTGHITKTAISDEGKLLYGFSLSKSALRKFILGSDDKDAIKRCLSDSVHHDLVLTDIRSLFLGSYEVEAYFTENVLHSSASFVRGDEFDEFRRVRADAMAVIKKEDSRFKIAIEYEHNLKYTLRYRDLLYHYSYARGVVAVIFICANKNIQKRICEMAKKYQKENSVIFLFALRDELLKSKTKLKFHIADTNRYFFLELKTPHTQGDESRESHSTARASP